ncbi:MAG: Acetoin:2,6-dichlorophenolindophenol oxidoreductase subunit beta [Alphaproteobacteria bacterium MarineAlpha5_Bin5]|nr:MAG: Acetoin:2,6-dichlorophenolindophenol oxidoreductase subunit beta [Alphaproteobacteria bacterium MarineAlpha5_Bin4]PPR49735.1 MAG: Acetoin:2,6-dichlorophenolindophenol oxidoreductase subunit beta [Alphaproteobacteria bacterium MarineAlpha5_Bin5]|tara:strand:- start:6895 stop:7911 length:1017 start_codon:yes stop_codon:yes gene_type:complete
MTILTVKEAINQALVESFTNDKNVILMGEDIAGGKGREQYQGTQDAWGGPFGVTQGLLTKFGPERVRDTTIAEAGFFGAAVGAAMTGLRPIVELMYVDFAGVCFDQLMNQAAKMRYMFGGKQNVPMVVRTVVGAGFRAGSEHSQTLYSLYTHIPGLKVVAPYDAIDAKGLLLSSIIDNDPVIFMEHKRLYMSKCEVPENLKPIPLGKGRIRKKGKDITIVAIQRMNLFAEEAANILVDEGVECEIIDPRTYSPLDEALLYESVKKTGKVIIIDESNPKCSLASEISSLISENCFSDLKAPILKLTAPHTPVPFSPPMEDFYIPSTKKIIKSIKTILKY